MAGSGLIAPPAVALAPFLRVRRTSHVDCREPANSHQEADGAAVAEALQGARELVAHGIKRNEDVSGQVFLIRDTGGERVATVPFRHALPGRLRD